MATPYYAGRWATVYLGDCMDIASTLERRSVDLLIADPPYGVNWQSNTRAESFRPMAGDDGGADWPAILGAIVQHTLRWKRHAYIFGYRPDELTVPCGFLAAVPMVWDKMILGSGDLSLPFGPAHESFTFGIRSHRPFRVGTGNDSPPVRLRKGSIVRAPRVNGSAVTRHPAEKPVALLRQLVEASSCLGETVLDPTCGVGSTGVAAVLAGRQFIGIELDERYAAIAVDRVQRAEKLADEMGSM